MRRWHILLTISLVAVFAGVYAFTKTLRDEHFFRGRSSSYWKRVVRDYEPNEASWSPSIVERILDYSNVTNRPAVFSGDLAALPVLVDLLNDPDQDVRRYVVAALADFHGAREVLPLLLSALNDRDPDVRAEALLVLAVGHFPAQDVFVRVIQALGDGDERVRHQACESLVELQLGYAEGFPTLVRYLNSPDAQIRSGVVSTLMGLVINDRVPQATVTPLVIQALRDKDDRVAVAAAISLLGMGRAPVQVAPVVFEVVQDKGLEFREIAAVLLGQLGPKAVPLLATALNDRRPGVRWVAATALGRIGAQAKPAAAALRKALKDTDSDTSAPVHDVATPTVHDNGPTPLRRSSGPRGEAG
jgi:HEAT repeat protein